MNGKNPLLQDDSVLEQPSLFHKGPISAALEALQESGTEERGAVFTRREVVDFMLDLAGYHAGQPLHNLRVLEPSCGNGDFLFPVLDRLLTAFREHGGEPGDRAVVSLRNAVSAVEMHRTTYECTRQKLLDRLVEEGFTPSQSEKLADRWLRQGDFLLLPFEQRFDYVVGNPPYVRQELIPDALIEAYRQLYPTIFDRADLYIPFIERSLRLLNRKGALAFICSDRWMKNRYGVKLRQFVSQGYHLKYYVDMVDTPAFHSEVTAYPAITVLTRENDGHTRVAHRPAVGTDALQALYQQLTGPTAELPEAVSEMNGVVQDAEPWILESTAQLALMRRLEREFLSLEEAGCKVGIGVATGADDVFIAPFDELDVEPDRKLRLVTTKDIRSGHVDWQGLGVLNPFEKDGGLVDLEQHPRLNAYLLQHEEQIRRRHVAKRNPEKWYRTIDRIYPDRAREPKLLIPDIKGTAQIVYEDGRYYPHHNLYYITAEEWDLQALQAVLLSGIARLFVGVYSTVMRGGYLRFQAQYIRRIRVPHWRDVPPDVRSALVRAARDRKTDACNAAVRRLYGLTAEEQAVLAAEANGGDHGA